MPPMPQTPNVKTPAPAKPVTALASSHAPRNARIFAALQVRDDREPPPAALMVTADDVLAPHYALLAGEGANGESATVQGAGSVGTVGSVLSDELGLASTRARGFLAAWVTLRRWKPAFALAGCRGAEINSWRAASPTFQTLFDSVESWIRSHRHHESEDTLYALANGEVEARKEVINGATGEVVSLSQGAIYSEKALALALAAGNPQLYGNAKGVSGAVSVAIQINIPPPPARVTVERTVSATEEPADAEYCEA